MSARIRVAEADSFHRLSSVYTRSYGVPCARQMFISEKPSAKLVHKLFFQLPDLNLLARVFLRPRTHKSRLPVFEYVLAVLLSDSAASVCIACTANFLLKGHAL